MSFVGRHCFPRHSAMFCPLYRDLSVGTCFSFLQDGLLVKQLKKTEQAWRRDARQLTCCNLVGHHIRSPLPFHLNQSHSVHCLSVVGEHQEENPQENATFSRLVSHLIDNWCFNNVWWPWLEMYRQIRRRQWRVNPLIYVLWMLEARFEKYKSTVP